jgi:hypothetical protein
MLRGLRGQSVFVDPKSKLRLSGDVVWIPIRSTVTRQNYPRTR